MRAPAPATVRSFSYLHELIAVDAFTIAPEIACPFEGMWGFNPSVIRMTSGRWLVSVRCANYSMPGGVGMLPPHRRIQNETMILDYGSTRPRADAHLRAGVASFHAQERDGLDRLWPACTGYEDLRLVQIGDDLCAVATAMQLNDRGKQEMVLLVFDDRSQAAALLTRAAAPNGDAKRIGRRIAIVEANPLRGAWSVEHQKNWTPYLDPYRNDAVNLLYSVERGGIYAANVHECWNVRASHGPTAPATPPDPPPGFGSVVQAANSRPLTHQQLGVNVQLRGGSPRMGGPVAPSIAPDRFPLRGGSQLIPIDHENDLWIGVAHGMRLVGTFKFYWHVFYAMNSDGVMVARSQPFKLSECGIEFCAGLALDPLDNTLVLSYGTDDMHANIATCTLADACGLLEDVAAPPAKTERRVTGVKESY